ncbi:MAG: hypothetical protein M0042_13340 [Nitrospiraceae bacterium]|nr:hypothetical protein [Nitrospiraceae bacterium]
MNIELTDREYRDLLDILHVADVIMSGHRREEDKRTERHRALIQKLYALAPGAGLVRLIAFNAASRKHVPTAEFEQNTVAHKVIDEYGEHVFWDQLIFRLTERDAAQAAGGNDRLRALTDNARQATETPIRQRYVEEFEANGITNLAIVQRFTATGGASIVTSD